MHNKKVKKRVAGPVQVIRDCAAIVSLALVIAGPAHAAKVSVELPFTGDCPDDMSTLTTDVSKSNKDTIEWTAVYVNADGDRVNYKGGYKIYFDPFKSGAPLKDSDKDGVIKSGPLHKNVPVVEFKYTIVGDDCADKPSDPLIRVQ